jgi:hypothetical protein
MGRLFFVDFLGILVKIRKLIVLTGVDIFGVLL